MVTSVGVTPKGSFSSPFDTRELHELGQTVLRTLNLKRLIHTNNISGNNYNTWYCGRNIISWYIQKDLEENTGCTVTTTTNLVCI